MKRRAPLLLCLSVCLFGHAALGQEAEITPALHTVTLQELQGNPSDLGLREHDLERLIDTPVLAAFEFLNRSPHDLDAPTTDQRENLVRLLVTHKAATERHLAETLGPQSTLTEREVAVEIYGHLGNFKNITNMGRLALGSGSNDKVSQVTFRKAMLHMIESDLEILRISGQVLEVTDPHFHQALVAAIEGVRLVEALEGLAGLLGVTDTLDAQILRAMGNLSLELSGPFEDRIQDAVRPYLEDREAEVRLQAIRTCGTLEDRHAVERLIDLMHSPEGTGERSRALTALRRITRQTFRCYPDTWRSWFRLQEAWWVEESRSVLNELHEEVPVAIAAINKLLVHPLYRHEIAAELSDLLQEGQEDLLPLVCVALGQLQSPVAIEPLTKFVSTNPSSDSARRALGQLSLNDHSTTTSR